MGRAELQGAVVVLDAAVALALLLVVARVAIGLQNEQNERGQAFLRGSASAPPPPTPPTEPSHLPPGQALHEDGLGRAELLGTQAVDDAALGLAFQVIVAAFPDPLQGRAGTCSRVLQTPKEPPVLHSPWSRLGPTGPQTYRIWRGFWNIYRAGRVTGLGSWKGGEGGNVVCVCPETSGQRLN